MTVSPYETELRAMRMDEAKTLAEFEKERPYPWNKSQFLNLVESKTTTVLVWEENQTFIGYVVVQIVEEEAYLSNFFVHPSVRRQGYGQKFMRKIFSWCLHRGVQQITLDVDSSNASAVNLYKKMGFGLLQIRARAYPQGESAAVMRRTIGNSL